MLFLHFFLLKKNFTKDNTVDDVIELSNKLKDKPNMPQKSQVTIQLGKTKYKY